MTVTTAADMPIIDTDSHLAEVPDIWTSRMSVSRWGDEIPHVVWDERLGVDRWLIGGSKLTSVANWATAGWTDFPPSHPGSIEESDPAAFYPKERLARMEEYGIHAQVLYPNLLAFSNHAFRQMEPALALECVQVYNDYLRDFAVESGAPDRFILLACLPFWDIEASLAEMRRCASMGFRGLLFIAKPYKIDLPRLADSHWEPLFREAQNMHWSINFHTGFAELSEEDFRAMLSRNTDRRQYAILSSVQYLNNAEAIADVVMSGLCHRFPDVSFVTVESGFGWIPSFVESMDWQWLNSGAAKAFPNYEMPSFYFRRQVYGMFWFEQESLRRQLDLFPDNLMYGSDFPHPTSLSPGPASSASDPRTTATEFFAGVPEELTRKIMYDNGRRLYHVDLPAPFVQA